MMRVLFFVLFLIPGALWASEEPAGCWKNVKAFPCAIQGAEAGWAERGGLKIYMGKDSAVILTGAGHWQILKGRVWVASAEKWTLSQLGREFAIEGEVWIEKTPEKISVRQFRGQTEVKGRFATTLIEGFENWWTLAAEGVLRPLPTGTLKEWNRWMKLPKAEAEEKIRLYSELWKDRIEESAEIYQEISQRRISSIEAKEDAAFRNRKRAEADRASMRQMFRDRYQHGL